MASCISYKDRQETSRIIIHDSHSGPDEHCAHEVSNWAPHAAENALHMGLLTIGYHFIIERDGKVVIGRPREKYGSHTPGCNMDSIGVCLVGGRDADGGPVDDYPYEQRKALIRLCHELETCYGSLKVFGHSEVQSYRDSSLPDCPTMDMECLRADIDCYRLFGRTIV
jgi:N-acetylmuramoyl-L-alanine amidase